ncbi:DNA polymerase III subunit [Thalassotalea agarivorans]|uniref:DNA-directed DNA polymerase n=1 Tax=Thalassotalea agarivorans TaxID=349064 RepID=A0A1I0EVB5_THASX|nr:DNA polymerase III subunit [Thalassotalea agarivorans]SET49078.1 DNA polymerase-3 subunit delta' [Thalassotalea agarivorans]
MTNTPNISQYQQQFVSQIAQQKLPHALLLVGHQHVGKLALANWLVSLLACLTPTKEHNACGQCKHCLLVAQSTFPDIKHIAPNGRNIGVDEIRQVSNFIEKTPLLSAYKSVVIEDADKMTVAASNALLKTLEEPTDDSFLILVAQDINALLPTIVSRCQQVFIKAPIHDEQRTDQNKPSALNSSHLPELSDEEIATEYQAFIAAFSAFVFEQKPINKVLPILLATPHNWRWLEKISSDWQRAINGWETASDAQLITKQACETLGKDKLWQLYQLTVSCIQHQKTFIQSNDQFEMEKYLTQIKTITNHEE